MKKRESFNYLERIPYRNGKIHWHCDGGYVTLSIENKGLMKKATQLLLGKPRISYVHLDKTGSLVWPLIDGKRDVGEIGEIIQNHTGEVEGYESLIRFMQILDGYGFVVWKE